MNEKYLINYVFLLMLVVSGTAFAEKPFAPESLQGVIRVGVGETAELIVNTPNLII